MSRLVLDTDSLVDDAHALMMAFAHPETHIEAITTVAGGSSLEQATANACILLGVLGRDVPVYAGCGRALVAEGAPNVSFLLLDGPRRPGGQRLWDLIQAAVR